MSGSITTGRRIRMNNYEAALFRDKQIGFFIYLGVEAIMFATLFATYLIFTPASKGPHPSEVFAAKSVILSSIFLFSSTGNILLAKKSIIERQNKMLFIGLGITFLFALIFLGLEIREFYTFVSEGYGITVNVFLSSFYVLVGLHAAHVAFGIGWMLVLFIQWKMDIPH